MSFKVGVITWGTNFTGSLELGYALEGARQFTQNRGNKPSTFQLRSGVEVGWVRGTDFMLDGIVRWVPRESGSQTPAGNPLSAWEGPDGWDAFIQWTREANQFRWHGDRDNASGSFILSTAAEIGDPTLESADGTYTFTFRIRNPNSPYLGY